MGRARVPPPPPRWDHRMGAGAGRASAAVRLLAGQMGWVWDWDPRLPRTPTEALIWTCYVTFGLYNILPVFNTFMKAWRMKSVGGGTRSEPFVASLLSYACWLFFSLMENGWKANESVWLNGSGSVLYFVYLLMFLRYTDVAHRLITVERWVPGTVFYVFAAAIFGVLAEWTFVVKVMCTLAGLASGCTSLVLTVCVLERKLEFLPDCVSTTVSLLHYLAWIFRDAIHPTDYFDMVQNVCGFGCCLVFLALPFLPSFWTRDEPTLANVDDQNRPLLSPPCERSAPLHQPLTAVNLHGAELVNLPATNVLQEPRRASSAPSTPKQVDNSREVVSAPSTPEK